MKNLLNSLLKIQYQQRRSPTPKSTSGFTMIELLVGTIIAFLITVPMLSFVVDMLNSDVREQTKANTEQDVQAAIDYIEQDLSQALYIYDQSGITQLLSNTPIPIPAVATAKGTPILVFWKRHVVENAIPAITKVTIPNCKEANPDPPPDPLPECNDTYVMSLVAYYLVQDNNSIWCQPSGSSCPARIARFEVKDGVRDPSDFKKYLVCNATNGLCPSSSPDRRGRDSGFNKDYNLSEPKILTGVTGENLPATEVLVNYIDQSTANVPAAAKCQTALGSTKAELITTATNSFYSCVDTDNNLAQVYIRGNSLRKIQTDANYSPNNKSYFPNATVQVRGESGL